MWNVKCFSYRVFILVIHNLTIPSSHGFINWAPLSLIYCNRPFMKGGRDQEILSLRTKIHPPRHEPRDEPSNEALASWLSISPKAAGRGWYWESRGKCRVARWVKRQVPRGMDWGLRGKDFLVNLPTWKMGRTFSTQVEGLRLNLRKIYHFQVTKNFNSHHCMKKARIDPK